MSPFLDDDNEWEPDHLQTALAALEAGPPAERPGLVYTALRRGLPDGRLVDVMSVPFDRRLLAREGFIDTNALVIRRVPGLHFSRLARPPGSGRGRTGSWCTGCPADAYGPCARPDRALSGKPGKPLVELGRRGRPQSRRPRRVP